MSIYHVHQRDCQAPELAAVTQQILDEGGKPFTTVPTRLKYIGTGSSIPDYIVETYRILYVKD